MSSIRLKPDLLEKLLVGFELHEDGGAERTVPGDQGSDAILRSGFFTFVDHFEILDRIIGEKILQDHFGLALAVAVTFIRHGDLNRIVEETGDGGNVTRFQSRHHFIDTRKKGEGTQ